MIWELWVTLIAIVVLVLVLLWDTLRKPEEPEPKHSDVDPQDLLEHDPHAESRALLNQLRDEVKKQKKDKPP